MIKRTLLPTLLLLSFVSPARHITIYLVGDSTMANKEIKAYPETGWGMPFAWFFDSTAKVDNRAKNGRSTQSFIDEHLWQPVLDNLKEGDYVFVQFGHNDEVPTKKTYTTEEQFRANLLRYVTETRSKKAIPVLITPVARRKFDSTGRVVGTHEAYSAIVRAVAKDNNVPLIDLDKESQALLQDWGVDKSTCLYNHLLPGENPHYPGGRADDTHFSELGARRMAEIVLADIRTLLPELATRIVKPPSK